MGKREVRAWTQEETEFLLKNRGDMTYAQMGRSLLRSATSVRLKLQALGEPYHAHVREREGETVYTRELLSKGCSPCEACEKNTRRSCPGCEKHTLWFKSAWRVIRRNLGMDEKIPEKWVLNYRGEWIEEGEI